MKITWLAAALAALMALSGCALLDALVGKQETQAVTDEGAPLFEDANGTLTTEPVDAATGRPNQPKMIQLVRPGGGVKAAADFAASFGPWGALIGALGTGAAGLYARLRNKQRLNELGLRKQAQQQLDETGSALTFALRLIEKIKQAGPEIDRDGDGKVSAEEIRQFVRDRGARFADPEFLAQVVRIANASLTPAQETAELRRAMVASA
jgi:hypothetical protein